MVVDLSAPGGVRRSFVFGERALINLFRGAGGLLGSSGGGGGSGLDTLNSLFQSRFQDYFWSSQVFDSYMGDVFSFQEIGSQQAQAFNAQFDQVGALGIVGYSAGGLSAIRTASQRGPQPVTLLVQIESYDPLTGSSPEDEILPSNVAKGINYYQLANRFNPFRPGFDPFDLQGARVVQGSENINAEDLLGDRGITHRTLDDNPGLHNQILNDVEANVLQDLRFDRAGQLSLGGGAQLTNNILSLAPDGNGTPGRALITDSFAIDADFSFQTRFEFRLPAVGSPGVSFWLEPTGETLVSQGGSSLAVAFEPFAFDASFLNANAIALLTPGVSPIPLAQAPAPLDLDTGQPLTAWVEYDGLSDQLAVFLGDTLTQPNTPVLSYGLDLPAITGPEAYFGFQTTVQGAERQADLLSWQLNTAGGVEQPPPEEMPPIPSEEPDLATCWMTSILPIVQEIEASLGAGGLPFNLNNFIGDRLGDLWVEQWLSDGAIDFGLLLREGIARADQGVIAPVVGEDCWQAIATTGVIGEGQDFLLFSQTSDSGEQYAIQWLDGQSLLAKAVAGADAAGWHFSGSADITGDGNIDVQFTDEGIPPVASGLIDGGLSIAQGVADAYQDLALLAGWQLPFTLPEGGLTELQVL